MGRWKTFLINVIFPISFFALLDATKDNCFVSESGYICCDKELETMMKNILIGKEDLLSMAKSIQQGAKSLRAKFETVVALDDFAYKTHFKEGKACKVEKNGLYAVARE